MRLLIAAVGKLKDGGEPELLARFKKRIDQSGRSIALGPLSIVELAESRAPEAAQRKADEAARLLASAERAEYRVILDEGGTTITSQAFADLLSKLRDDGVRDLSFLIGGPDGHGDAARQSADATLSLSRMTLPHGLARVVLAEQIYRALTIISGHPYHRN